MILLQKPLVSMERPCEYIPERMWRFEYFFAEEVSAAELEFLLERGWRKFGIYYFAPSCDGCSSCIPIRIPVKEFVPAKGQRRIARKAGQVEVRFGPLDYRDDVYDVYRDHSMNRFGKCSEKADFISTFYARSCPSLQSEYYLEGELVGCGFLDVSSRSLSSVYFVFKTSVEGLRLGTFSVMREIEHAASLGLDYYYLGYYIEECGRMSYKNGFRPNEKYDWEEGRWIDA